MSKTYVLDTHVLIWYFIGSDQLKSRQKEEIEKVRNHSGQLLIPTIVLAEALDVAEKGRVEFNFSAMYDLIQKHGSFEITGFSQTPATAQGSEPPLSPAMSGPLGPRYLSFFAFLFF
ncbi:MAG TPA: PIN domain-containing protein [Patescibacteria group bacterium]|nr:PIN domain-containing protein [Patescibacteria group bacterium]